MAFGGEISYEILENPENGKLVVILPVLEGDPTAVALRLGPNIIRMGFKCGRYYDLKDVASSIIEKLKARKQALMGERDPSGKTIRAYEGVVIE